MSLKGMIKRRFNAKLCKEDSGPKQYENIRITGNIPAANTKPAGINSVEERMVNLIDELDLFKALQPDMREALKTKNVKRMLQGASPWAIAKLVHLAETSGSDSAKVAALKDILDRAGYGAVQKQAIMSVDGMTPQELEAKVRSNLADLKLLDKPEKK